MKTKKLHVEIKLTENQYDMLKELCISTDLSKSDVITIALRIAYPHYPWH